MSNAGETLSPYVSEQYEVGGKLSLGPVDLTLALFQIDRETAILRIDPADSTRLQFGPYGIQRNRGIEFTLAGEISKGLRLIAAAGR